MLRYRCLSLMCMSLMMLYATNFLGEGSCPHTHTTSQALEVLVRWYAAKNSHRQDPQHTWRTLWLNMCKWAQFWRVEESYCDWPMSSPTRLLTNVVSLFLAFVARFWNCDNETSASVGIIQPVLEWWGMGGSKPHMYSYFLQPKVSEQS